MNVKSGGGPRQHNYPTKSITIPHVPNGKSRDRVEAGGEDRMPEGRGNSSPGGSLILYNVPTKARGISTHADASKEGGVRHIWVV